MGEAFTLRLPSVNCGSACDEGVGYTIDVSTENSMSVSVVDRAGNVLSRSEVGKDHHLEVPAIDAMDFSELTSAWSSGGGRSLVFRVESEDAMADIQNVTVQVTTHP